MAIRKKSKKTRQGGGKILIGQLKKTQKLIKRKRNLEVRDDCGTSIIFTM